MDLNGKKVLVTTGGGLGDMICFMPALRRLKEKYPHCQLTFMTRKGNHEVVTGLPYLDKVIFIRRGEFLGRYRVLPDFYGQDAVVFTDWQPQLLMFAKLFGIPVRAGTPRPGKKMNEFLTYALQNNVMVSREYAAETNAKIFSEALGIDLDGDMTHLEVAPPTDEHIAAADTLLHSLGLNKAKPYILLSPFTSLRQRDWQIETAKRFVEMAQNYYGVPVVTIGAGDRREEAENISSFNLVGKTSTMQLVALIKKAACLVTPDSGPMHVAAAVGTPCVALFGKDLPSRWAPRHNCEVVCLEMECAPCPDETVRNCPYDNRCMKAITPEMVLEACNNVGMRL